MKKKKSVEPRKLVCYNVRGTTGRWLGDRLNPGRIDHIYVCGHSRIDCVRRIRTALKRPHYPESELRDYGSPCWGMRMAGVTPKSGVWITRDSNSEPIGL